MELRDRLPLGVVGVKWASEQFFGLRHIGLDHAGDGFEPEGEFGAVGIENGDGAGGFRDTDQVAVQGLDAFVTYGAVEGDHGSAVHGVAKPVDDPGVFGLRNARARFEKRGLTVHGRFEHGGDGARLRCHPRGKAFDAVLMLDHVDDVATGMAPDDDQSSGAAPEGLDGAGDIRAFAAGDAGAFFGTYERADLQGVDKDGLVNARVGGHGQDHRCVTSRSGRSLPRGSARSRQHR